MAKTTNTKKATDVKATTKTTQKVETKKVDNKKENKEKKPELLDIQAIQALYKELGIRVANPEAKGKYRIMGNKKGSSLNLSTTAYTIYSTDTDYENVVKAHIDGVEATQGSNTDPVRRNTVVCKTTEVLKKLLKVYAQNPFNTTEIKKEVKEKKAKTVTTAK